MPRYLAIDYISEASEQKSSDFFELHLLAPKLNTHFSISDEEFRRPWLKLAKADFLKENKDDIIKDATREFDAICDESEIFIYLKLPDEAKIEKKACKTSVKEDNTYNYIDLKSLRQKILTGDERYLESVILNDTFPDVRTPQISEIVTRFDVKKIPDILETDFDEWRELFSDLNANYSHSPSKAQENIDIQPAKLILPKLLLQEKINFTIDDDEVKTEESVEELEVLSLKNFSVKDENTTEEGNEFSSPSSMILLTSSDEEENIKDSQHILSPMKNNCNELLNEKSKTASPVEIKIEEPVLTETKFDLDDLNMFFMMRKNVTQRNIDFSAAQTAAEHSSPYEVVEIKEIPDEVEAKPSKNIAEVYLTSDFESVFKLLETHAKNIVSSLKDEKLADDSFWTLSTDKTRFMLHQHLRSLTGFEDEPQIDEKYCKILCLHGLLKARDCIWERSLECSLSCLDLFLLHHKCLLGNFFDNLYLKMRENQTHFAKFKILHPKMKLLISHIDVWINTNPLQKAVIFAGNWPNQCQLIRDELVKQMPNLGVACIEQSMPYLDISKTIEKSKLIVTTTNGYGEDFPWNEFSLLINWEHQTEIPNLDQLREKFKIDYIGFVTKRKIKTEETEVKTEETPVQNSNFIPIICSKSIEEDDLIIELENGVQLKFYTRDYEKICRKGDLIAMQFADITVDERNAILIRSSNVITSDKSLNDLIDSLFILSLKFLKCWLILQFDFLEANIKNVSKLFALFKNFEEMKDFSLQVLYAGSTKQTVTIIHKITEICVNGSPVWKPMEWLDRSWLTEKITLHEKFLLNFPCINSVTAQIMLASAPLKKLLTISLQDLIGLCPQIPEKIVTKFHELTHKNLSISTPLKTPSQNRLKIMNTQHAIHEETNCKPSMRLLEPVKRKTSNYFDSGHPISRSNTILPRGAKISRPATSNESAIDAADSLSFITNLTSVENLYEDNSSIF